MRRFVCIRNEDKSGVSGVGTIAEGMVMSSGTTVIQWLTGISSIAFYPSFEAMRSIHGHAGATKFRFLDPEDVDQPAADHFPSKEV